MKTATPSTRATIRIGALAGQTGCSIPTIRYYEEVGLIPRAMRTSARQRLFGTDSVQLLILIRRCRDFGFTIEQIRELVALARSGDRDCAEVRDMAKARLASVRERLAGLKALELQLARFIAACNSACLGGPAPECSIFKDLAAASAGAGGESACCGKAASVAPPVAS